MTPEEKKKQDEMEETIEKAKREANLLNMKKALASHERWKATHPRPQKETGGDQTMTKTFSEQFKEARAETGLSLAKLSERMLISKRTLESWDGGLRTPPPYVQRFILNELETLKKK